MSTSPSPPLLLTIEYLSHSSSSCTRWRARSRLPSPSHEEERRSRLPPPSQGREEEYAAYSISIVCLLSSSRWSLLVLHLTHRLHPPMGGWGVRCVHYSIARRRGGVHHLLSYSSSPPCDGLRGLLIVRMRIRARPCTPS